MDPQTASILSQLDNQINSLLTNQNITNDEMRDIQAKQKAIHDKAIAFRQRLSSETESFVKSLVSDINSLNGVISNDIKSPAPGVV
ncbi:MAG: hypothetical protein ABIM99_04025 [Candidatus Dojkabacteria bacterium]